MRAPRLLLAGALLASLVSARAELANGIKAIVHDSIITYVDVEDLTSQTADVLVRQYRRDPAALQKKMQEARDENLDRLLSRELILHEFSTAGYSMPDSVIDEVVQQRIRSRYGDRVTLTKTLQAQGITFEKFKQQVREQFIVEAMRSKNIAAEIIISPYKIENYYAANKDKYKVEDQVKLRMIVLNKAGDPSAKKLADEIAVKLKEGADFAEMAGLHSQGSQRNQGGDWGWVEKSVLRKELADVAFTLKAGQVSEVIDTPEACYLMKVEEAREAHVRPLSEVRDEIERNLVLAERERLEKQWIEKLKKKTFVRYF